MTHQGVGGLVEHLKYQKMDGTAATHAAPRELPHATPTRQPPTTAASSAGEEEPSPSSPSSSAAPRVVGAPVGSGDGAQRSQPPLGASPPSPLEMKEDGRTARSRGGGL